ncbi:MAG: DUF1127 domain-containing protein [Rhizobiales bacterium]|nr:DUF1127 domain-containing protein [Hyphomicrobiales bacterium]
MSMTAMTLNSNASGPFARAVRVAGVAGLRVVEFYRSFKSRREMRMLAGFDDRMLADIGLTRSDLRDAVSEPLWRDPTHVLVTRVRERRAARPASHPSPAEFANSPSIVPEHRGEAVTPARYY